jgi:predicted Rossmann fold nucleotide-binding protein DprA/Smf involved in DNA uptake
VKLAIVGSVKIDYKVARKRAIESIILYSPTAIVSGGAVGVDSIAEEIAAERSLPCIVCKPGGKGWEYYKERNILIAELCDTLVAIRSKDSKTYGSGWTADYAEKIGKPVERILI